MTLEPITVATYLSIFAVFGLTLVIWKWVYEKPAARAINNFVHYNVGDFFDKEQVNVKDPILKAKLDEIQHGSDEQLAAQMTRRFEVLQALIDQSLQGNITSLAISGPAGLGKSYPVEKSLEDHDSTGDSWNIYKGHATAAELFAMLYRHRAPGSIMVLDDLDSIFKDETALNILKAALDTTEVRKVSYNSTRRIRDEVTGDLVPKQFVFEGSLIFISNLDFDILIDQEVAMTNHLKALVSRSHYINLEIRTTRQYVIRIKQVAEAGLFARKNMTPDQELDVLNFIDRNRNKMRDLSLRAALKIADLRLASEDWEDLAKSTMCRN